jgi:hypothetical protein
MGRATLREPSYRVPLFPPLYIAQATGPTNQMWLGAPDQGAEEVKGPSSSRWARTRGDHPNTLDTVVMIRSHCQHLSPLFFFFQNTHYTRVGTHNSTNIIHTLLSINVHRTYLFLRIYTELTFKIVSLSTKTALHAQRIFWLSPLKGYERIK